MATNRAMIILQENTGRLASLDDQIPGPLRSMIRAVIDHLAETFEDVKNQLITGGQYDVVHELTDANCTKDAFYNALSHEFRQGRLVDVIVLGHGSPTSLTLHGGQKLTAGDIAGWSNSQYVDPSVGAAPGESIRMVFMCNCYASYLNDDWLAAGANVSIGSRDKNYMPEPMTTYFMLNWLAGMTAGDAARRAYEDTIPLYRTFLSQAKIDESEPLVDGYLGCTIDSVPVRFLKPAENDLVYGKTRIRAYAPGAHGADFEAYYATDPSDISTVDWHPIGKDDKPPDYPPATWSCIWNSATIPDQGNAGWGTVNLAAFPRDKNGHHVREDAYRRVDVKNSLVVGFLQPTAGAVLSGRVLLEAQAPQAKAVKFTAYYATDPANNATIAWRDIGYGQKTVRGWQCPWDTRGIPSQGNAGLGTVNLAVFAVDEMGEANSARGYCLVTVNNEIKVEFLAPTPNSRVRGTVRLHVRAPGALAIKFFASSNTGGSTDIGRGVPAAPGEWTFDWDSTSFHGAVVLCAYVDGVTGTGLSPRAYCRVTCLNR